MSLSSSSLRSSLPFTPPSTLSVTYAHCASVYTLPLPPTPSSLQAALSFLVPPGSQIHLVLDGSGEGAWRVLNRRDLEGGDIK
ncbi:hypothetical protein TeGR_g5670 [Tetraparma gracilis]|nr:hypothetical protein TeGR_g5670 [Tetraparma gracilis]